MIEWSNIITNNFRSKAITDSKKLHIGMTLYSFHDEHLTVIQDHEKKYPLSSDMKLLMFKTINGKTFRLEQPLFQRDWGIGDSSYNPWLLFENKQDAQDYYEQVKESVLSAYGANAFSLMSTLLVPVKEVQNALS